MEWVELFSHWKELGSVGVVILVLAKLGDKIFAWLLDVLGVNIKRSQSREDGLAIEVAKLRLDVDAQGKRLTKIEGAYDLVAALAHRCADGIAAELKRLSLDCPTIQFFVDQLRAVQTVEDVLKD